MGIQSGYRYTLKVNGKVKFEVVYFTLTEHLSQPFVLDVDVASFEDSPNFTDILDKSATLTFWNNNKCVRYVNGIVTRLEQCGTGAHRTRYKIRIEPELVRARLQSDCRIFQLQDSQKIIRTLLTKNGIKKVNFTLEQPYWKRDYCVQYRETDFDFIQRLAAEEGTYYYFEHTADSHVLHFCDNTGSAKNIGKIFYNDSTSTSRPKAIIWSWGVAEQLCTTSQTLRDYTFTNPRYNQEHKGSVSLNNIDGKLPTGKYEKYDYPGRYKKDEQGKLFAKYRQEYERQDAHLMCALSDNLSVVPGYRFTLTGHHRKGLNQGWLMVGIVHRGKQTGVLQEEAGDDGNFYENEIKIVPQYASWRPEPMCRPVVSGPQVAHVVGPKDEEIYCDEWGRVKIQFPWDRLGKENEHSTCWVRVSQASAGAHYGNMTIPRIGHEVIVDFLEGDPDQPIVMGRTYHSTTKPIYELPKHKTRMSIRSQTHKGEGYNELTFEDEKDKETLYLHAQKDYINVVKNDKSVRVGGNRLQIILKNDDTKVLGSRTRHVEGSEGVNINGAREKIIRGDEEIEIGKISKERKYEGDGTEISFGGAEKKDKKEEEKKKKKKKKGGNRKTQIEKNDEIKIGGDRSTKIEGKEKSEVKKEKKISVGKDYIIKVKKVLKAQVKKSIEFLADKNFVLKVKKKNIFYAKKEIRLATGKSLIKMNAKGEIVIQGTNIQIKSKGPISLDGKDISTKASGAVDIKASKNVTIKGQKVMGN